VAKIKVSMLLLLLLLPNAVAKIKVWTSSPIPIATSPHHPFRSLAPFFVWL